MAFVLGNDSGGGRSFAGTLHYVALDSVPLTDAEVQGNGRVFTVDDDAL